MTPRRRKGDRSQAEGDRKRPLFACRLDPDVAAEIRAEAAASGRTIAEVVEAAWTAYAGS